MKKIILIVLLFQTELAFSQNKNTQIIFLQNNLDSCRIENKLLRDNAEEERMRLINNQISTAESTIKFNDSIKVLNKTIEALKKSGTKKTQYVFLESSTNSLENDEISVSIENNLDIYYLNDKSFAFYLTAYRTIITEEYGRERGGHLSGIMEINEDGVGRWWNEGGTQNCFLTFYFNKTDIIIENIDDCYSIDGCVVEGTYKKK